EVYEVNMKKTETGHLKSAEMLLYALILLKPILQHLFTGTSFLQCLYDLYISAIVVLFIYCLFRIFQNR
uniref:hypothetical protein n=2 Tax=Faecalibaculum rodentium TaxID=1702221 RepID=UPI00263BD21D